LRLRLGPLTGPARTSTLVLMNRLSRPLSELSPRYDAVVIGSGYGGAIAACRLAQDDRRVCLLERGVERHPGDYPDTMRSALPLMQARFFTERGRLHHIGSPTGLFDVRIGRGLHALVGCGLGGTPTSHCEPTMPSFPPTPGPRN
jgi:cholesterol oxidase